MSEKTESAAGVSSPRLLGSAAHRAERVACSLWYHARYDRPGQTSEKITPALLVEWARKLDDVVYELRAEERKQSNVTVSRVEADAEKGKA